MRHGVHHIDTALVEIKRLKKLDYMLEDIKKTKEYEYHTRVDADAAIHRGNFFVCLASYSSMKSLMSDFRALSAVAKAGLVDAFVHMTALHANTLSDMIAITTIACMCDHEDICVAWVKEIERVHYKRIPTPLYDPTSQFPALRCLFYLSGTLLLSRHNNYRVLLALAEWCTSTTGLITVLGEVMLLTAKVDTSTTDDIITSEQWVECSGILPILAITYKSTDTALWLLSQGAAITHGLVRISITPTADSRLFRFCAKQGAVEHYVKYACVTNQPPLAAWNCFRSILELCIKYGMIRCGKSLIEQMKHHPEWWSSIEGCLPVKEVEDLWDKGECVEAETAETAETDQTEEERNLVHSLIPSTSRCLVGGMCQNISVYVATCETGQGP